MIPGRASAALIPNQPSSNENALSLFLIHSFRPASSLGGGSPPPMSRHHHLHLVIAFLIAISMEAIIIPCSLNRVRIISEVSLSNTFAIVSRKLVIWFFSLPLRRLIDSCLTFKSSLRSSIRLVTSSIHCIVVFSEIISKFLKLATLFSDAFFQLKLF